MKKLLLIFLLVATTILPQGVTPTTVIEIDGGQWDGAAFSGGYTGPAYTEWGSINASSSFPGCGGLQGDFQTGRSDSLTFSVINSDTSNYAIFVIAWPNWGNYSADTWSLGLFGFLTVGVRGLISLGPQEMADGVDRISIYYGLDSYNNHTDTVDFNWDAGFQLYLFLAEGDSLRFYANGVKKATLPWEPCPTQMTGSRNRLGGSPSSDYSTRFAHASIHKVDDSETVNRGWINDYADALVAYYEDCTLTGTIAWTPLQEGYGLVYPSDVGIYINAQDTVDIYWTADQSPDTTNVWFSSNNGISWEFIGRATGGQDSLQWIVPEVVTTQALIIISNPDSSFYDISNNTFTILDNYIDILYPDNVSNFTIEIGDTVHVIFESAFVEDFSLFWSEDSLSWYLLDEVVVDTVNGFLQDTTLYVWHLVHGETGPTLWLRATQATDTTLYYFVRGYTEIGNTAPVGLNTCQSYAGGNAIEKQVIYDVSCGWANPPIRYYNRWIYPDATGYTQDYYVDPSPIIYPRLDPVYTISGGDTTTTMINAFYDSGPTVTYLARTYYISNKKLYCNDNLNGIDSILVSDLTPLYSDTYPWVEGEENILVYNVQWDSISNKYLPADTTFENLNSPLFEPLLIIESAPEFLSSQTIIIEALPFPNSMDPAEDIALAFTGLETVRYYFRGIHPKAEKR